MKKFGLIGFPLTHSFSKKYFTEKFEKEGMDYCLYENYPIVSIESLPQLIDSEPDLAGLNVTIPYKEEVLHYLDEVNPEAKEIGAINTIKIAKINGSKRLIGYNTDVYGFRKPLEEVLKPVHAKALILGTGGASKAVAWVLKELGISYSFVSRNPKTSKDLSYESLSDEIIRENLILINTSPVGMYPDIMEAPKLPYYGLTSNHILYDLVYNPEKTSFLRKGEEKKGNPHKWVANAISTGRKGLGNLESGIINKPYRPFR
jgi:shikimate dehydrogenase